MDIPKPILKWVGGKTQILDNIINKFPNQINNYHEIFLGGGSVLFALLTLINNNIIKLNGKIYAYDLNEPLIYVYKNIQKNHNELYEKLETIINEFNNCKNDAINRKPLNIEDAKLNKENYYYWIRDQYNKADDKKSIFASAMFIFLNKTGFRGIFREGPNGYNVPYGNYKSPKIINKRHLEKIHNLIQNVIFECCDFKTSLSNIQDDDFVYLDPPYVPETKNSFTSYTKNGFNITNHNELFKLIKDLKQKKFILSNSNVKLVIDNFQEYNIEYINCKRVINSKNPKSTTLEVIINNY
jgi:DNA adenine methylase